LISIAAVGWSAGILAAILSAVAAAPSATAIPSTSSHASAAESASSPASALVARVLLRLAHFLHGIVAEVRIQFPRARKIWFTGNLRRGPGRSRWLVRWRSSRQRTCALRSSPSRREKQQRKKYRRA
jgi:hypothetical protein